MNKKAQFIGLVGLVVLLFGVIALSIVNTGQSQYFFFAPLHLVLGFVFVAVFLIGGGLKGLRTSAFRRAAGFGASATLYSTLFVSLIAVSNYLAAKQEFFHYDSSAQKVYSLAPQTIGLVERLPGKLEIRAFYLEGRMDQETKRLLTLLSGKSSKVSWRLVDPEQHPELLKKYEITQEGTIHFSLHLDGETRVGKVNGDNVNEQGVANALLKLVRDSAKKIYTLDGHGEGRLTDASERGYLFLKDAIEGEYFQVEELILAGRERVPEDAAALLVIAPRRALLSSELEMLNTYIGKGGRAIFLHEIDSSKHIAELVRPLGIEIGEDIIVDRVVRLYDGPGLGVQPMVHSYSQHPITKDFEGGTIFTTVSSVRRANAAGDAADANNESVTILAKTGFESWAETDLELLFGTPPTAVKDPVDTAGPVPVAAAFEGAIADPEAVARVVVFGDADFVMNNSISQLYNRDLFLNALNWVVGEDEAISIRPRALRDTVQPISQAQFSLIFLLTVILLPEVLLLGGLSVWWKRRSR